MSQLGIAMYREVGITGKNVKNTNYYTTSYNIITTPPPVYFNSGTRAFGLTSLYVYNIFDEVTSWSIAVTAGKDRIVIIIIASV